MAVEQTGGLSLYATRDDESEARALASELWDRGRRAGVMRVTEMHRYGLDCALRTTDRWAIVTERG